MEHSKYIAKALGRFQTKYTIIDNGCWIWTSVIESHSGRGRFYFQQGNVQAHRFSAEYLKPYPLKDSDVVCHHCDNPICVNPNHLFIGKQKDNIQDMIKKDRSPHTKLTIAQVLAIKEDCKTMSPKDIRKKYNISKGIVERIKSGRSWKHVLSSPCNATATL